MGKNSAKKRGKGVRQTHNVDEPDWREFKAALEQFMKGETSGKMDKTLLREFPIFRGKAPVGHPYPQAWTDGATDEKYCYVEEVDDMVLLRRKLNMNNGDNRVENLKWVAETEARKLLMDFDEGEAKRYKIVTVLPHGVEEVIDMQASNMRELHGWESDTADITKACHSFWHLTGKLFQLQAVSPSRSGLKVVQVGTEKVMARLELNPPSQDEKKAAFGALSAAIEDSASMLPEEMYRQLHDKAKAAFDVCI